MFGRLKQYYVHGRITLDKVDKMARYMWAPILPDMNDALLKELVWN